MRTDLEKKRVFLLCGHAASGKTSLCEQILFKCGAISRLGRVEDGNTVSDFDDDEKERKSSISLSLMHADYKGNNLQFIDTPGYLDFIGELILAAQAVDFAVIVVDAAAGVEVGTEKAWDIARSRNLPCMFFVNKLDKEGADFEKVVNDIRTALSKKAVPFIDYKNGKLINAIKDKSDEHCKEILEAVAETSDKLLEEYLSSNEIKEDEITPVLKQMIAEGNIFPIVAGVAAQGLGVDNFLVELIDFMPSVKGKLDAPFTAQVFKTVIDPFVGKLNLLRVYSGKVLSGEVVSNVTRQTKEKVAQFCFLQGKDQAPVDGACAGDIVAVAKLKDTATLDVFYEGDGAITMDGVNFPSPAYSASVKPKTRQDEEKISLALQRLEAEDLTFHFSRDSRTGEEIISGMGELHLNAIISRMRKKYHVDVDLGTPKVPYKETATKRVRTQGKHKKQSGGHGQYGDCWIELEPLAEGKGFEFVNNIVGGAIPKNFIPSVEKGIMKAMESGVLAGFKVDDVRVRLVDGSYHDVDSSDMAFQLAGTMAMKAALEGAACVLLEPIMNAEVSVPGEFTGQVTGDINSRRGRIMGMDNKGKSEVVKAQVPLAEMFKYASDLRSVTGGRGSYSMGFAHYAIVPPRIAQAVVDKTKQNKEEAQTAHN
jgi:elongation factor G